MNTRNKQHRWLLHLLGAAILLLGLAACGSSEGSVDEKEPEKPKPEVPVADGDWQVVPATGGTITKDSISITFPSGTFSEETKVAITEIKKGEIGGKYEASKFYQITMPCTASQPIVLKMKSSEKDDDICFVAQSDAFSVCSGEDRKVEYHYDTNYSNGEYTTTIPAIKGDLDEDIYFTIGLGHILDPSTGKARTRSDENAFKNQVLFEGKVNNVNYKIRYMWTILDQIKWSIKGDENFDKIINMSGRIHNYVKESMTKIMDLGIKVDGSPTIYIDIDTSEPDWGGHNWCLLPISTSWMTYVSLGTKKLLEKETTDVDIKTTIIHEIFHWFQSFYDPRSNIKKQKHAGDEIIFYEMGGVWIENLMNDGQLNAKYINVDSELWSPIKYDKMGLTNIRTLWATGDIRVGYRKQGYCMAPLLYYLCSSNEMKEFGFNNGSIVELHDLFTGGFTVGITPWVSDPFVGTLSLMDQWTKIYHDSNFFTSDQIDDYYIKLLNGTLIKGVDVLSLYANDPTIERGRKPDLIVKDNLDKFPKEWENLCYPFGCTVRMIRLQGLKDVSFKDKKLVIKQKNKDMQTYLLTTGKSSEYKSYIKDRQVANDKDSIIISGSDLEALRLSDGSLDQYFVLITTRMKNSISDTDGMPWKVTVELQGEEDKNTSAKVEPDKVEFDAMGGSNNEVKIIKGSYKNCGVDDVQAPDSKWLSAKGTSDGAVTIEAKPNMSFEGRKGEVKCWVSNKDNPQPGDKKYLTVEVIQNGVTGVDWDPKSLRFTASGGSEKISFKFGEFTRFGAQVRKEGQGWCGVAAANGKLTITVQPNETKEPRECIVDAYVTNSQNPTEEDKVIMPITVYQEGAKETKPSSLKIKSVVFSAEYNDGSKRSFMVDWNKKEGTIQAEIINGSTHVTCTNNTGYNKSTLSFDIDNESLLTSKKATFSNFKTEGKEYYMSKISNEWNIATKSKSDYDYYTDLVGEKTCSLYWKQGEFTKFEHSQTNNSITLSDSNLSELNATVSIFFEEPPQ